MPKKKPLRLPLYDLKQKFTTLGGKRYYNTGDPSENLVLWARAATKDAVPTTAIDDSGNGHTVVFNDTAANQVATSSPFENKSFANLRTPVRFPKSATPFVKVNDADDLSFGDGTDGGDADFTMTSWMLFTSGSATAYIMSKSTEYEFLYHSGALTGSVIDTSATAQLSFRTSLGSTVNDGTWHHLAFTYDASAHSSARGKLYLDGSHISGTCTPVGTYVGMEPSSNFLSIANNQGNQAVEFFDAAIWNKVLVDEEISALYNIPGGLKDPVKRREYITSTGITSLPPRPYLNMIDNETGSYPSIPRNGDLRLGRGLGLHISSSVAMATVSAFNDTKAINFHQIGKGTQHLPGDIVLGVQLPQSSQYSGSLVTAVNSLPDLKLTSSALATTTNIIPGISDARVRFTPGDNYQPYVEDKQFALDRVGNFTPLKDGYPFPGTSAPDPFYATGTLATIFPGLEAPLWQKEKIEIEVNPGTRSETFWSTGSAASPVGSGVSYYNFDLKRWEMIRCAVTGSDVDYAHPSKRFYTSSCLMMVPPQNNTGFTKGKYQEGSLCGAAGFPSAHQFNATSSQLFSLKNKITHPFIVEKIAYEFKAMMPGPGVMGTNTNNMVPQFNFGIMNQFRNSAPKNNRAVTKTSIGLNGATGGTDNSIDAPRKVTAVRDLISYGIVTVIDAGSSDARRRLRGRKGSFFKEKARDGANLLIEGTGSWSSHGLTGSFILSMSANVPLLAETMANQSAVSFGGRENPDSDSATRLMDNLGGGRSGLALASEGGFFGSGRSLSRSVVGSQVTQSLDNVGSQGYQARLTKNFRTNAPYLVFPEDELCFYWGFQPWPERETGVSFMTEQDISNSKLKILPGSGKIILYGTTLRNGESLDMGLNQNLTSLSIHEDVQSSATDSTPYCLDQFDVEYRSVYSGSYIDNVFEDVDPRRPSTAGGRLDKIPSSSIAGSAGTTGSLLRAVRLPDPNERYYDSLFPDASVIASANGKSFVQSVGSELLNSAGTVSALLYPLGNVAGSGVVDSRNDRTWPRSYPFDIRYGGNDLERVPGVNVQRSTSPLSSGSPIKALQTSNLAVILGKRFKSTAGDENSQRMYVNIDYVSSTSAIALPGRKQNKTFLKAFYGFGDSGDSNLPIITSLEDTNTAQTKAGSEVQIRGFKYGLISALPTYTSCVFRQDRYGQFRDMLEQRPFTAIQKFQHTAQEGGEIVVGGQKSACVSVAFKKAVAISNTDVQVQGFTSDDLTQIENNSVGPRGIWNSTANIDTYSRTNRPFYDVAPLNTSGSIDPGTIDASLLFELGGFTGA